MNVYDFSHKKDSDILDRKLNKTSENTFNAYQHCNLVQYL